jgi:hypothetical protein
MANYYLDFVGLNTLIRESNGWDEDNQPSDITVYNNGASTLSVLRVDQNTLGFTDAFTENPSGLFYYQNGTFSHTLPTTASFFPALMLYRNGPY